MAQAGAVSLVPPWPPDVCVQIRDPRPVSLWSEVSPASVLFPEVAPAQAEVAIPLAEEVSPSPVVPSSSKSTRSIVRSLNKSKEETQPLSKSKDLQEDASPPQGKLITRSSSLPSPSVHSEKSVTSAAVNGWTRVASKSSPPKSLAFSGKSKEGDILVTSSQFDSEEVLISEAQQVIRNRLAAAEADFPPFSSKKDKKYFRKIQRQAVMKECETEGGVPGLALVGVASVSVNSVHGSVSVGLPVGGQPISSV
ncbi:unnamed protein product [Brassica rapa subsp. trilocularis]